MKDKVEYTKERNDALLFCVSKNKICDKKMEERVFGIDDLVAEEGLSKVHKYDHVSRPRTVTSR